MEMAHSKAGITTSQRKYCFNLLNDYGLLGSKHALTPLNTLIKLYNYVSSYIRLVDKLPLL